MSFTGTGAPVGGFSTMTAPRRILAPATEFIMDGSVPVAQRLMTGTHWWGTAAWGEVLTVGQKRVATLETPSNGRGGIRGMIWKNMAWEVTLKVQHERTQPYLELGKSIFLWVLGGGEVTETGLTVPVKKRFHVTDMGDDVGDDETVMYSLTLLHRDAFSDISSLFYTEVDESGLVRLYEEVSGGGTVAATATAPGMALPVDPS